MAEDEPLDDARQVAIAAAAAAARVVETMAREARDQAAQHRATLERAHDQQRARQTLASLGQRYENSPEQQSTSQRHDADLAAAETWATPDRLAAHGADSTGCDSPEGRRSVDQQLISEWKAATKPYDSADRHTAADQVREAAGVPAEARQARATADLMNGTDPAKAAQQGAASKTSAPVVVQSRTPARTVSKPPQVSR